MKISVLAIGIEVAEAVVEAFGSEAPPDPVWSEAAGNRAVPAIPQPYRVGVSVILEVPDGPKALLGEASQRGRGRGAAGQPGETLSPFLAETGRLGLKAVLARGALLALPALAMLAAPRIARAALPVARRNTALRNWVRGLLPAQAPRLPPAP